MSKYESFIFKSYSFDSSQKILELNYSYDDDLEFKETFDFDFEFADYSPEALDKAAQLVFFTAGVSYFKAYLPKNIEVRAGQLDEQLSNFFSDLYQNGLGEFFYVNRLDPQTKINFPITNDEPMQPTSHSGKGCLVGIGGGKDSLVSVDLLQDQPGFSTWSVGHRSQLTPLIDSINPPVHYWVERKIDPLLLELNNQDALNGHVPISALFAALGALVAVLAGKRDVVVSNESSANEPTLNYAGVDINHQYSKSLEFEKKFAAMLTNTFGETVRYYSLLRPYTEHRISELFAMHSFEKYKSVFTSCNRAFVQDNKDISWCGECAKCAFVFLMLTPFIKRQELEDLYGKNLLLEPSMQHTYQQLLGIKGDKPLDCVGEIKEARIAMNMAKQIYPGKLDMYQYDSPENYDYKQLSEHAIPDDVINLLKEH